MQIIKFKSGKYGIENDMGQVERNQMGDVVYYDSIPFMAWHLPIRAEMNNPFSNPLFFDPLKKPFDY